ncbi:hypothetical protein OHB12_16710 [Nocardia sp. NBC_01730]|uniref:hypothetical protein n=1 Tax=Nocardia sp. NBC_01730 TaxID=2975998 RepID=UPI002E0D5B71|nr:hypothetical protein OHB12_16710 [Nocardia sp. NBC_01730]
MDKKVSNLQDAAIVVGTAAKRVHVAERPWPWAIVDEAYQMRSDMLLRVAPRFDQALMVGDPGHLEVAAGTGWALHELPARHTMRTDSQAVEAITEIAVRLLERGADLARRAGRGAAHICPKFGEFYGTRRCVMGKRLLVTGSRSWEDRQVIQDALAEVWSQSLVAASG